jgi:mannose-6-phosphate isomerase-like protein (cupin superfamily)
MELGAAAEGAVKGWRSVKLADVEPVPIEDGAILWQPLRKMLDVGAFGINAFVAPDVGDDVVEKHTEEMLGLEEVYVVLTGRATFKLGEETLDAPAGTVVFVHDPALQRHARAVEPKTVVLAVGAPRGSAYEPPPWEAELHRASGDFDAYADELLDALTRYPDHPGMLYVVSCAEALAGRQEDAIGHLGRAIELRPTLAGVAQANEDLASLRDRPDWPVHV